MTVNSQIPAIYAQALAKYHETTKGECPLDAAFLAKLHTVEDLTHEIDLRNSGFTEYRQKRGTLFNALQSALLPIQLFGNLAAGGASMAFPPSSLIFGAVSYLMGAAKGVSDSYDAIQDLMGTLKDFTIRLKAYNREAISEDLSNKLSDILVTLLEIFALATKTIRRGRLLKFTRNVLLGSDDAIQASLGKLDKLTRVEASLVGAETLTESKRTGRVVDGVSVTVTETNTTVTQMNAQVTEVHEMMAHLVVSNKEKSDQRRQNVAQEVLKPSSTDFAQDWYEKITKARLPGTGDWIHNEEIFKNWVAGVDTPVLFVTGNPGAGKSYLSANIISFLQEHPELLEQQQQEEEETLVSVGYFFFKDDNPHTRSFHQALRDLAYQISKIDPVYEKYISSLDSYASISTIETAWRVLFTEFFLQKAHSNHSVYICLDGVDEAFDEERQTFLHLARELYDASSSPRLHFVFVGRPHLSDQLLEALDADVPTIHVTSQKNSSDIERYIKASIKKSVILRKVSAKLRQEIFEKLSAGAEGMFLWVNLMLQELVKKRSESSMRKSLNEAPKGLREMLRHVLWSFSSTSTDEELMYLNEMLLWTACSSQQLNLEQVEMLLRLQSPEGDGMIDPEGALRKQFAAFFTVDRVDGLTTAELLNRAARQGDGSDIEDEETKDGDSGSVGGYSDGDIGSDEEGFEDVENLADFDSEKFTTTVTFCHASIGDFLRDENEGKVSAGEGHVSVGVNWHEAQLHVLKTYLKLLTDEKFQEKSGNTDYILQFAGNNWVRALRSSTPSAASLEEKKEIVGMLVRLFTEDDLIALWLEKNDWVSTQENLDAVQQWLQDEEVVKSLTPEQQEFVASTKDDPRATFKPLITLCVKKWVLATNWNVVPTSATVWAHMKFLQGNEIKDIDLYYPTAEEIIEAAEFAVFEKNATWYRRCAITLREKGFYDEALEYFTKATELDPTMVMAKTGLAKTYMCKKDWQKALDLYAEVEQILLKQIDEETDDVEFLREDLHYAMMDMGTCYREQSKDDRHFDVLKRSIEYMPQCDECINAIIVHQHQRKLYADTMEFLEGMAEQTAPDREFSRLTLSIWQNPYSWASYFKFSADAALETDRLDFLIDAWRTAGREARKAAEPFIAAFIDMSLAKLYAEWANDQPKAIRRLENIISTLASAKDEGMLGVVKDEAAIMLATGLLCRAVDVGVGTPEATEVIAKLVNLGQKVKPNEKSSGSIARARSVALGVYYRLCGRVEEARDMFRPSVKRCIALLSDDDPGNDYWGLIDLLSVLLASGDGKNALVVAYFLGKYPDEMETDDEHAIREFARGDSYVAYRCDGPCHKPCMVMDGLSLCTICPETGFCSECRELLRQDQFTIQKCSPKHVDDFLVVPTREQTPKGDQVIYDGAVMEFQAWMELLKKEWRVR